MAALGLKKMALDVQAQSEQSALDGVLRHHLQLEPASSLEGGITYLIVCYSLLLLLFNFIAEAIPTIELQNRKTNHQRAVSQPPMKFSTQVQH